MMTHATRLLRGALVISVLAFALAAVDAQEPAQIEMLQLSEIDLSPTLGIPSTAYGLNDIGTIVGSGARLPPSTPMRFGFVWSREGGLLNLGLGEDVIAFDVNNHDEAVGKRGAAFPGIAMLWRPGDDPDEQWPWPGLPIAAGAALGINDATTVVGVHYAPSGQLPVDHAFRWSNDGLVDVESLTGMVPQWYYFAPLSVAHAIREDGVMAGMRDGHAVIWGSTGHPYQLPGVVVTAISDAGLAVGAASYAWPGPSQDSGQPLMWRDGVAIPISEQLGAAFDVNEAGYVVGRITVNDVPHAFVWHETLGLRDLGPGAAYAIDEVGRIVGQRIIDQKGLATLWRLELPIEHLLLGLETVTRRLVDPATMGRADEHVYRAIAEAREDWTAGHVKAVSARLRQVSHALDKLQRGSDLAPVRANAIREIATELLARLGTVE